MRPVESSAGILRSKVQGGMSLIELMIALVLSLIVVAALAELFVNMSRSTQEMAKTNSQIENARFAMQYLRNDIVHAGFWGGLLPNYDDLSITGTPTDLPPLGVALAPDPCQSFDDWDNETDDNPFYTQYRNGLIGIPFESRDTMPAACGLANHVADTDIIIVRHANTCERGEVGCDAYVTGDLYLQLSNCEDEIDDGDTFLLDPNEASLNLTQRNCTDLQPARRFMQSIYYVRDWSNTVGDGVPALVRSRFMVVGGSLQQEDPAEVMVEGIERMRVEVGIDNVSETGAPVDYGAAIAWADEDNLVSPTNRGDGIPDGAFVHCGNACTAEQLIDVVAVKFYILSRANEATQGYVDTKDYNLGTQQILASGLPDNFKRHVFSTTVRLNNVSGRRETPDPNDV